MTKAGSLAVVGGTVIDPSQNLETARDLLIEDGRVSQLAEPGTLRGAGQTIVAKGLIVAPGFVDIHVHLREPGQAHKETIASGTAAAAAGGFTSVCAMPNTTPVNDLPAITRWMRDAERGALVHVYPVAAATRGSQGEKLTNYAELKRAGAVAVSDDGHPVLDDDIMRKALELAKRLDLPLIQHAEDTRISHNNPVHEGEMAFRLGLRGQPVESEWRLVRRDLTLARQTEAHLHVAHVTTAISLDLIRQARRDGVQVTCEVTPHHFTFTDAELAGYDTNFKMNPPLRGEQDRAALLEGLLNGTVDCIATDHAPHARFEKYVEFDRAAFGVTGLEIAFGVACTALHHERGMPLAHLIKLFSANPAKIVRLEGRGTLAPGAYGDVTIFDPKKRWKYDLAKSRSKSRNAPWDGVSMQGCVTHTIVGGRVVYGGGS
ncbi:MAG: dihydroorotase [Candidatus Korobacteraceae bacterium]